jgi:predicted transcriptional regulator|tara:strand:+ start:4678 stop:5172 length:495 start_codon:yes stop_codon:yes gene_type:complete
MTYKENKYDSFMQWIIEIAEEKILEHKLLKENFNSHEEFIIFTIIWMRVYKKIYQALKNNNSSVNLDKFIKNYYNNQEDQYLGMTINAITRESEIPRSTVKRTVERLIVKEIVSRNSKNLIIPTAKVRDVMESYRQFNFKSHKKLNKLFNDLKIKERYTEEEKF